MIKRWLTPAEAALRLGISQSTLTKCVREGVLPKPTYITGPRSPRYDL